ncbi:MAG: sensor histidine kinase [Mangrovibacterium sp.]
MFFKVILIVAIITQFVAAGIAISLIRKTKYNASWILLTAGFFLQAIRLVGEYLPIAGIRKTDQTEVVMAWSAILMAFLFVMGVFYIQKIFKYMHKMEAQRRHNEKLLLNATIQAEEKERKRFAKEVHDGLGPLLSTIKMSVSALSYLDIDEKSRHIVENTNDVIDEAIKSIKEISNNLSPHVLENFGLVRAVQNFVNKLNALQMINITFRSNLGNRRFERSVEVVLYRVICELINNTIKHAKAKNIEIDLSIEAGKTLVIVYNDDGIGMDAQELEKQYQGGMGISNIFSRITSLKGTVDLKSKPTKGLNVNIKVEV